VQLERRLTELGLVLPAPIRLPLSILSSLRDALGDLDRITAWPHCRSTSRSRSKPKS
jgi:hypothetical protein